MRWRSLVSSTLLAAALALPASASNPPAQIFDDSGRLYEVLAGRYGDLLPHQSEAAATDPVLALRITEAAGSSRTVLVPGTEGPATDEDPVAVFDAGRLFVLWSSGDGGARSELLLTSYDGTDFGERIEVSGDPRKLKGSPRIAVTQDPYDDSALAVSRTIVHLLWWEEDDGQLAVFYTPVLLLDGNYLGWNPVVALDVFDLNPSHASPVPESGLFRAATLERGTDGRSVVIGLPQQRTSRLITLQVRVLPSSLVKVANDARTQITLVGRNAQKPISILSLADISRSHIASFGKMHQGVLDYISDQVYSSLLTAGPSVEPEAVQAIADLAWHQTLLAGASILGNGLRSEELPCSILFLGGNPQQVTGAAHQIEICLTSDRPAPDTEPEAPHTLLVSESGNEVLVAWEDEGVLHYRLSDGDGWSGTVSISTSGPISSEQALKLLRQQVRYE